MNGMTTDIYFDLKDKEEDTQILMKLLVGIKSLCNIHSDHLFLLLIYFKVTENYQVSKRNRTHPLHLSLIAT